ncbi:MAG: HAMP domain-containing protein [Planctomycetes bacterium]|nr:HAMP domain-containing protein [Planctomycetota bacterium]
MKRLSLRTSLLLWFLALTLLLWIGTSAALYLHLRSSWYDALDQELAARAEGFLALCEVEVDGSIDFEWSQERADQLTAEHPTRSFEVWTWPHWELLRRSGPSLPAPNPDDEGSSPIVVRALAHDRGARRMVTMTRTVASEPESGEDSAGDPDGERDAQRVVIRVADTTAPIEDRLASLLSTLLGLGVFSLVLLVAFGFFLSRRIARPLRNLARTAERLRAGQMDVPWPRRGHDDELDRLAGLLDDAFTSLRHALDRQRRFVANAAHELRNPLASLSATAEVASRRPRSESEYRVFFEDVLSTSRRLNDVVDGLLWLARAEHEDSSSSVEPIELATAIHATLDDLEPDDRARVVFHAPRDGSFMLSIHPVLYRIALRNLIDNALRHAHAGTHIEVHVARDGNATSIHVSNEGEPLDSEQRERVFERFHRGPGRETAKRGAGLGLAITRAIAERFGGTCSVCDHASGRTCFVLAFPCDS